MDQTALRPKPMPGRGSGPSSGDHPRRTPGDHPGHSPWPDPAEHVGPGHRPHAVVRRGRRPVAVLSGLLLAVLLVLAGIGIGAVGAGAVGVGVVSVADLAGTRRAAPVPQRAAAPEAPKSGGAPVPGAGHARPAGSATLGIEAVDAPAGPGALVVGVRVPGPGHTAGLLRGDTLLAVGGARVDSAARLASAVAAAHPGRLLTLTVRHQDGRRQYLGARPGVVT